MTGDISGVAANAPVAAGTALAPLAASCLIRGHGGIGHRQGARGVVHEEPCTLGKATRAAGSASTAIAAGATIGAEI